MSKMRLTSVDKGTSWGKGLKYETGTGNVPYGTPIYKNTYHTVHFTFLCTRVHIHISVLFSPATCIVRTYITKLAYHMRALFTPYYLSSISS